MPSSEVMVAIITTAGAFATAVGVKILANKRTLAKQPKDRIELAFEYYDGFINQQKVVIDEQSNIIKQLRTDLDEAQLSLEKVQEIVQRQQEYISQILSRIEQTQKANDELHVQLDSLRKSYKRSPRVETALGE